MTARKDPSKAKRVIFTMEGHSIRSDQDVFGQSARAEFELGKLLLTIERIWSRGTP
jgi:hypothetical protein